ncbi:MULTISPECIES: hypothetical protein [unclassified Microcoleus]|uniref:hypothetical protein n=1 Tax=unclassified Microcoleus TaxID=2642155 RepID=UPI002FD52268
MRFCVIFNPKFSEFDANFGCEPTIDCCWGKLYVTAEILHHSQLAFYEQAFRPVPQKINFVVEQAEKPVGDKGARCELPGVKGYLGRSTPQARTNSFNIKKQ